MRTNQDYKNSALSALKGNWTPAVLAALVYGVLVTLLQSPNTVHSYRALAGSARRIAEASSFDWTSGSYSLLVAVFIVSPLAVGLHNAFRCLYEHGDNELPKNIFNLTLRNYLHKVWGQLLKGIYIFLWSLLLLVPGIIKAFSYAMTPYILDEHPELSADQAIEKSMAMMKGHKFDIFYLYLSFIGWFFLAILTCGIGFFWLIPYVETSVASFYYDLKVENGEAVREAEVL